MRAITPQTQDEKAMGVQTDGSRIHEALISAEQRFGPRDPSFTLTGFDFKPEGPRLAVDSVGKSIEIWIQGAIANEPDQVLYQASHEIIHVLSPVSAEVGPTVLDEGLAQLFSEQFTKSKTGKHYVPTDDKQNYAKARDAVATYMTEDLLIRKVRAKQPVLARVTPELLIEVRPDCPRTLAEYLCSKFQA